jgi:AcrR family transcriptional regulator
VNDLKNEAGVTGGAFSHHFPTKKALGLAVVEQRVAGAVEQAWIEPVRSAASAADGVRHVFAGIAADLDAQGSVTGCPLGNLAIELSGQDAELRAAIDGIFMRWRDAIAGKLRADQAAGHAPGLDPDAAATFVVATYSGAMTLAKASQDSSPLKACAGQLVAFLGGKSSKTV